MRMGSAAIKLVVVFAACLAAGIGYAQPAGAKRNWVDSFDRYRSTMRSLSPAAGTACESQLHHILMSIDQNQTCSDDSECTLLGEEPFGPTVPVRASSGKALTSDMKQFRQSCYDESRYVGYNTDLVHRPACVMNRCVVKTSVKR
jgi:hypothetical protein